MEFANAENAWVTTIDVPTPELIAQVQTILHQNRFCTLATTAPDGMPWASPLLFAYDRHLTLYWSSAITAQHSQNLITPQGQAAIVIYDSTATTGNVAGLYFTGVAREVPTTQVDRAMQLLFDRLEHRPQRTATDYLGDSPRRMYQFSPQAAWITGERIAIGNQLVDTKVKLNLSDVIRRIGVTP
jgi:uncharacterized protein YhbP (UPF0306 family)